MSEIDTAGLVSQLRDLRRKTTQGRWRTVEAPWPLSNAATSVIVSKIICALQEPGLRDERKVENEEALVQGDANAAFICAAKNHLPVLLKAIDVLTAHVRELEAERDALSKAQCEAETRATQIEAALIGPDADFPTIWRIGWLHMFLDECRTPEVRAVLDGDDPDSCSMMLDQIQALHDDAWAALLERQQSAIRVLESDPAYDNGWMA